MKQRVKETKQVNKNVYLQNTSRKVPDFQNPIQDRGCNEKFTTPTTYSKRLFSACGSFSAVAKPVYALSRKASIINKTVQGIN
jgi:hypothetical protein